MAENISLIQAQKLVLHSQKLPPAKQGRSALQATLNAVEHLGYIQIDTISAIQRAHHHTLWNRNPRYKLSHIDRLTADRMIFEYWAHAAAYLPMKDYRFTLRQKQALARGEQNHWFIRDQKLMKYVKDRITAEGPLMARDFEHKGSKISEWGSKPAKQALENLFMQGELMILSRNNFHKVYDLTERVIPENINKDIPSEQEQARFLITTYLKANGIGQGPEICYLLKNIKPQVTETLKEMLSAGEIIQITVKDKNSGPYIYFALPDALELLNKPLGRNKLKILSPFDNLLIQRRRMQILFGYDYLLECYVPEIKRQYGYFSLPVLWDGRLTARADCRADRKKSVLHINHLALEQGLKKKECFASAFQKELAAFLVFNNCESYQLHRTTPASFKPELHSVLTR